MITKSPTVRFSGTLPREISEKLKEMAIIKQRSVNGIINIAVREYVERYYSDEYNDIIKG